ncbi:hypothetical protein U14_00205 [Candidatus Moduliflexus flocculans]|uniref:Metallo-beta-lactamase domain-containing protein n=1 Tax=Candidatus Moduliflexus flocculans TaxID=1499966 RepID=A0A0S6VTR7_9BACT|nr:hypothetical protein U14_00205 [Candidatus Moduliflexus flocculans]
MTFFRRIFTTFRFAVLTASICSLLHSAASAADGVTIYYEENAQTEIISPSGTRVLIDVIRPSLLSGDVTPNDVLLVTHTHNDHYKKDLFEPFAGAKLMGKEDTLTVNDVTIRSIASAHNEADKIVSEKANNYIFLIETGGLRIAHFGDIGQKDMTPEQLQTLGKIDIAITQFENSFSSMNFSNKKGMHLMEQVMPRLMIPTHNGLEISKVTATQWGGYYSDQKSVTITPADLTDSPKMLFMGMMGPSLGKITSLPAWESRK